MRRNSKKNISAEITMACILGFLCAGLGIGTGSFFVDSSGSNKAQISIDESFKANAESYNSENAESYTGKIEAGSGIEAPAVTLSPSQLYYITPTPTPMTTPMPTSEPNVTGTPGATDPTKIDDSGFLFPESDTTELTFNDLIAKVYDSATCQRAINEIYARHGYQFDPEIDGAEYEYFNSLPWYKSMKKTDMTGAVAGFSQSESYNMMALQNYRDAMGW